ncbi:hypothetical protein Tco_0927745 [Tanacetum coccineum]
MSKSLVVVKESSVRSSDLQFNVRDGALVLTNVEIFENLALMEGTELPLKNKEIAILKKRVKKLEKRKRSRTQGLKLFKYGYLSKKKLDRRDCITNMGWNLNGRAMWLFAACRIAANLYAMSETSKEKSIVFEDVEESAKEQRKGKAPMRAQARRNRPMTQTQQRTYMSNYLKHQGSWTSAQLKKLSDEEIKAKYESLILPRKKPKALREVKEVPVTEEPVKEPTAPKQEEIEQPIKKSGRQKSMARKRKLGQSMARKRKLGQSTAKEDEEYSIIAWNSEYYGPKPLHDEVEVPEEINMNVVTRLNGSKRYFSVLSTVLSIFDRDDLSALYQLVIDKYQDEIPKGFDLILWGDLTTMFHPNEEDDFWKSQEKWNIMSWKLHKSTGVHTLETDTEMVIHMLVEKKYPLMKKVLLQMLELKLESEDDSTMALELIKFIKQQI